MAPEPAGKPSILLLALVVELGLGAIALAVGGFPGQRGPLGLLPSAALGAVAAAPPLLAVYAMGRSPRPAFRELLRISRNFVRDYLSPISLPAIVLLSVAAGLGEELLFRGLIQRVLSERLGLAAALVATSAVFALLHAVTRAYAFYAFLLSLYLGVLFAATGNIAVPIVTHAVYDAVLLYVLDRDERST
ncbi:MAG: CPBP family intramembrane glutamic endopeptidase [Spirochaetaceae bacterium]